MRRFDVYLVTLDPATGHEIKKARPAVIISPDEMNLHIDTVIIAPMTNWGRDYPTRIKCEFQSIAAQIVLDQIQTVDKQRLTKKLGTISPDEARQLLAVLAEMFQT